MDVKAKDFFIGDQNTGSGDRMAEAWRHEERHGDGFAGLGGHSKYQEAPEVILRGSWLPCTPFLLQQSKKVVRDETKGFGLSGYITKSVLSH